MMATTSTASTTPPDTAAVQSRYKVGDEVLWWGVKDPPPPQDLKDPGWKPGVVKHVQHVELDDELYDWDGEYYTTVYEPFVAVWVHSDGPSAFSEIIEDDGTYEFLRHADTEISPSRPFDHPPVYSKCKFNKGDLVEEIGTRQEAIVDEISDPPDCRIKVIWDNRVTSPYLNQKNFSKKKRI